jgi:hypothetical protein
MEAGHAATQAAPWVRQVAEAERDRIVRAIETMEPVDAAALVDLQKELAVLRRFARRVEGDIAAGRRAVEETREAQ